MRQRGERLAELAGEPAADGGIIGGGAGVGFRGQRLAQVEAGGAALGGKLGQHARVVLRLDHDRDGGVVLGGGADHGRAADVDVLDALVVGCALRDGRLERVEIDHQQVDGGDAVRARRRVVLGIAADGQQAAVHLRDAAS